MSDRRKLVTDPPDPDCMYCRGTGTVGGCHQCRIQPVPGHVHSYSFCRCVNERWEADDE